MEAEWKIAEWKKRGLLHIMPPLLPLLSSAPHLLGGGRGRGARVLQHLWRGGDEGPGPGLGRRDCTSRGGQAPLRPGVQERGGAAASAWRGTRATGGRRCTCSPCAAPARHTPLRYQHSCCAHPKRCRHAGAAALNRARGGGLQDARLQQPSASLPPGARPADAPFSPLPLAIARGGRRIAIAWL